MRPSRSPGNVVAAEQVDRTEASLARRPRDGALFVAERQGQLVGFVTCFVAEDHFELVRPEVQIRDMVVTRAVRGQGAGRRLIEAVRAFARARGIGRVTVTALAANESAVAAYHALGFRLAFVALESEA